MLEAGHGRVSDGWLVGHSLQPWRQGRPLAEVFSSAPAHADALAEEESASSIEAALANGAATLARVRVGGELFDVYESMA